ncbi:MAG: hypothetical protein NXI04_01770 [Planctomycetaceae bacterium]|nr:hypothetical protein [Planctomycetaceae bacterium]
MNVSQTTTRLLKSMAAAALVVAATDVTLAQSGARQTQSRTMMKKSQMAGSDKRMMTAKVGLDGYCPVCIVDARKWEKGNPRISSTFDGLTYYFPSTGLKTKFDRNPQRYVPALNGDCIVCLEKADKRVPGSIYHAALHNNRLYLFPSEKEKQAFSRSPEAFEKTDLAANGECIVCLAKMNKHVPGSHEHTVVHKGLRYLFPSAKEADMFRKDPAQFVSAAMKMQGDKGQMIKTGLPEMKAGMVTVSGLSGCAACEFGVSPLNDPEELGLAIVSDDGRITVVEGAHQTHPQIYNSRFKELQLVAQGEVLKQEGKVTWLKAASLQQTN